MIDADDIAKARERLEKYIRGGGFSAQVNDVAALLADHARLEALCVPVLWRSEINPNCVTDDARVVEAWRKGGVNCLAYALISTERVEPK